MTKHTKGKDSKHPDANADPLSGAPGAHPVGTAAGAASGAAAGAAVGAVVGGPIGFAAGGAVGAVVGGLGGKAVAEAVNPTAEHAYWRENYSARPYAVGALSYDMYQPADRTGWEARTTHADRGSNSGCDGGTRRWSAGTVTPARESIAVVAALLP